MEVGTYFGDGRTMLGVSLLLMAYGGDENRETGRLMTSTFISTGVIVWGMKEIIGRKRPLDEVVGNPAFPSGHTAYAFAGATLLASAVSQTPDSALHRRGIGWLHPDLSWQALRLRCDCRCSGWHDHWGAGLTPRCDTAGVAVLIWECPIYGYAQAEGVTAYGVCLLLYLNSLLVLRQRIDSDVNGA